MLLLILAKCVIGVSVGVGELFLGEPFLYLVLGRWVEENAVFCYPYSLVALDVGQAHAYHVSVLKAPSVLVLCLAMNLQMALRVQTHPNST